MQEFGPLTRREELLQKHLSRFAFALLIGVTPLKARADGFLDRIQEVGAGIAEGKKLTPAISGLSIALDAQQVYSSSKELEDYASKRNSGKATYADLDKAVNESTKIIDSLGGSEFIEPIKEIGKLGGKKSIITDNLASCYDSACFSKWGQEADNATRSTAIRNDTEFSSYDIAMKASPTAIADSQNIIERGLNYVAQNYPEVVTFGNNLFGIETKKNDFDPFLKKGGQLNILPNKPGEIRNELADTTRVIDKPAPRGSAYMYEHSDSAYDQIQKSSGLANNRQPKTTQNNRANGKPQNDFAAGLGQAILNGLIQGTINGLGGTGGAYQGSGGCGLAPDYTTPNPKPCY